MSRQLPSNNYRQIETLIVSNLGYCCEWFFFSCYTDTNLIAARLGVTPRAVRYHIQAFKKGDLTCQNSERCSKNCLEKCKIKLGELK